MYSCVLLFCVCVLVVAVVVVLCVDVVVCGTYICIGCYNNMRLYTLFLSYCVRCVCILLMG